MTAIALEAFAIMERDLIQSTIELFDSYGIEVSSATPTSQTHPSSIEQSFVAVIGYAGQQVRGALVMVAAGQAVESWIAATGEITGAHDVCDALGEFSNMLLGRLKGRLLREGFPILLSTPTAASGDALRLSRPVTPHKWLAFDGPGWRLHVRIDATFEEDFQLQPSETRETPVDAGDMLLF